MRLWSLHPSCLDSKGLVALWRESLLARKVLQGQTHGYRHHAQLIRFQAQADPVRAIECYLWGVYEESVARGYHFDGGKVGHKRRAAKMPVTEGQLRFEFAHLACKLKQRNKGRPLPVASGNLPRAHPLFRIVAGAVEKWERIAKM